MANYIEQIFITGWRHDMFITPADSGYLVIPMYGQKNVSIETGQWIVENLLGKWSCFRFGGKVRSGTSYCFELESDAMAFKLMFE